jgi:hypothetical protein
MKVLLQIIRPLNPSDQEKLCQFGGNIGDRFAFFILGGSLVIVQASLSVI